jgi:hypothetical protein
MGTKGGGRGRGGGGGRGLKAHFRNTIPSHHTRTPLAPCAIANRCDAENDRGERASRINSALLSARSLTVASVTCAIGHSDRNPKRARSP